jgi:hypothetical protein
VISDVFPHIADDRIAVLLSDIIKSDQGVQVIRELAAKAIDTFLYEIIMASDQGTSNIRFALMVDERLCNVPSDGMADYWRVPLGDD